ncbi:MAG: Hpt domain-containing protein [Magnetococcus sp. DMHC-6]
MSEQEIFAVLDQKTLLNLQNSMKEMPDRYALVLEFFLDGLSEGLASIEEGFKAQEAEPILRHAHSLKSQSAIVGALKLSHLFKCLEQKGRANVLMGSAELIEQIHIELQRVRPAVVAEIKKSQSCGVNQ